jgi:hypothetical protein
MKPTVFPDLIAMNAYYPGPEPNHQHPKGKKKICSEDELVI